jgi:hypothetical protein
MEFFDGLPPLDARAYSGDVVSDDNADAIDAELRWLEAAIAARLAQYGGDEASAALPPPPAVDDCAYGNVVVALGLGDAERLILALAFAPHIAPTLLDPLLLQNQAIARRFTEFGGVVGQVHAGFLPTVQTARFLLAGTDIRAQLTLEPLHSDHPLVRDGLVMVEQREAGEPHSAGLLRLSAEGLHRLLHGGDFTPPPGPDFPASVLDTPLDWGDLVLDRATATQVDQIRAWIEHGATLMRDWGLAQRLKPGYRCLFHGPPGTGKTLTAALLGKRHGRPVYRVDLSRVVSKWIGETEKNLATLFDQAADRDWILFFDEADALFGKRGEGSSANDRAANQQIAFLLQRLEAHPGVAVLATNQHDHLDEAFARRFQIAIRFPMPDAAARERLWRESFASDGFTLAEDVDFTTLAEAHEVAGGAIINVLRHAALAAVVRTPPVIHAHDLLEGVRSEKRKEGRYIS